MHDDDEGADEDRLVQRDRGPGQAAEEEAGLRRWGRGFRWPWRSLPEVRGFRRRRRAPRAGSAAGGRRGEQDDGVLAVLRDRLGGGAELGDVEGRGAEGARPPPLGGHGVERAGGAGAAERVERGHLVDAEPALLDAAVEDAAEEVGVDVAGSASAATFSLGCGELEVAGAVEHGLALGAGRGRPRRRSRPAVEAVQAEAHAGEAGAAVVRREALVVAGDVHHRVELRSPCRAWRRSSRRAPGRRRRSSPTAR